MKIGIMAQGYVRSDSTPQQRILDVIEQAQVADEEGLDAFLVSEQHFKFPTNSTGPIISIMAAVAKATKQIKIVPAAVILPLHHPLNVAEEWASIDIISGGRLCFGAGAGNTPLTADIYKVPLAETRERFDECLSIIVDAWSNEKFEHSGTHYNFPEIGLCPRPHQRPHPPIAYAGSSEVAGRYAGSRQIGFMTGATGHEWEQIEAALDAYDEAWPRGVPFEGAVPFKNKTFLVNGFVSKHFATVRDDLAEGVVRYINRHVEYRRIWLEREGRPQPDYGAHIMNNFDYAVKELPTVFGAPDECIEKLRRFQKLGVDRVDITVEYVRQEEILECIRLLGREVAPALN